MVHTKQYFEPTTYMYAGYLKIQFASLPQSTYLPAVCINIMQVPAGIWATGTQVLGS